VRAAERARREALFREELTSAELRALRAQVDPHFLFNSLNTIADLAVIAPSRAEEMTLRLSAVFRYVLVNTDRHFASLDEELEFARSYLDIEQMRFGDRLQVLFDIDPTTLSQPIPTLLLQPLIENALKHGLAPRRGGGTLVIASKSSEDSISISIADNGAGLGQKKVPSERSTGVGVENVTNRLKLAYGGRASFVLRPRETGGTEALIIIPKGQEA
jgi:two-component system LytT family sensor kinase